MYIVKTMVKPSNIHGMGCFLDEPVKKDQTIWVFDPRFDLLFNPEEVEKMNESTKELIKFYGYLDTLQFKGWYIYSAGNDRFTNHSKTPNLKSVKLTEGQYIMTALKDLESGEELTCDYDEYEEKMKNR